MLQLGVEARNCENQGNSGTVQCWKQGLAPPCACSSALWKTVINFIRVLSDNEEITELRLAFSLVIQSRSICF